MPPHMFGGAFLRAAIFLAGFAGVRNASVLRINSRPYALAASHTAVRLAARNM